jgi:hypothetical protein
VTLIGYTMMCEQAGPKQLVRDVTLAEQAGFESPFRCLNYWTGAATPAGSSTAGGN